MVELLSGRTSLSVLESTLSVVILGSVEMDHEILDELIDLWFVQNVETESTWRLLFETLEISLISGIFLLDLSYFL